MSDEGTRLRGGGTPGVKGDGTRVRPVAGQTVDASGTQLRPNTAPPDETQVRSAEASPDATRLRSAVAAPDGPGVSAEPAWDRSPPSLDIHATAPDRDIAGSETAAHKSDRSLAGVRAASSSPLREGDMIRGRFLLEELIGQGAMGQVWRAKDLLAMEALERTPHVALKVLNSDFERHSDAFTALYREASRAQKLAHPNVVTVQICDRDDETGRAFIVMELLEGQPLDRVIRAAGPSGVPAAEALPIIRGMAEGLAYAHRKGIVHSDFKPANVFLTRDGVPKILDFGIARAVQVADQAGVPRLVAEVDDSVFQGYTTAYAAPEVLSESEPSTSDDVFALGVVSYELLNGRHPFNRRSALEAHAAGIKPDPLRGVKRRHAHAIAKAMAFDRAARYSDAAAFNRALQGIAPLQKVLTAALATTAVLVALLWYRGYIDRQPALPFEQLALTVQQEVSDALRQGDESLKYMERTRDITASADAAEYFSRAYALHPRNPDAVAGLERAADEAIAWYSKSPDRAVALEELRKFQAKSEFYEHYAPLVSAIESLGR